MRIRKILTCRMTAASIVVLLLLLGVSLHGSEFDSPIAHLRIEGMLESSDHPSHAHYPKYAGSTLHPWHDRESGLPNLGLQNPFDHRGPFDAPFEPSATLELNLGSHDIQCLRDSVEVGWVNHYASGLAPSWDRPSDMAVDAQGNIYITGTSHDDFLTLKYDAAGQLLWSAYYDGPAHWNDYALGIGLDENGNVYVAGTSAAPSTGYDYTVVKYDSNGEELWAVRYAPDVSYVRSDTLTAFAVDETGNSYATGQAYVSGVGDCPVVVKHDAQGMLEWAAVDSLRGFGKAVAVDEDENVWAVSRVGYYHCRTSLYDSTGSLQWASQYSDHSWSVLCPTNVVVDEFGNAYVTGSIFRTDMWDSVLYDYITLRYSPDGTQEWARVFNNASDRQDIIQGSALDQAGNLVVTGYSYTPETGYDYLTIKYDAIGDVLWMARYHDAAGTGDTPRSLAVDSLGNVYVTGDVYTGYGNAGYDIVTIKYDYYGVQQWIARYNGSANGHDRPSAVVCDPAGNPLVTGSCRGEETSDDYLSIKYSSSGTQEWTSSFDGTGASSDYARGLSVSSGGTVAVTGISFSSATGYDCVTVQYETEGTEQWIARFNESEDWGEEGKAVVHDDEGNVIITGGSHSDCLTLKYDPFGILMWEARFDGGGNSPDAAADLQVDGAGNVYVTGAASPLDSWGYDYVTVKYDSEGVEEWVARYHSPDHPSYDEANAITLDGAGNVIVTGKSDWQYATIKYNPSGMLLWTARYEGPAGWTSEAFDVEVDQEDNIYVTGQADGDFATVKYSPNGMEQWVALFDGPGYYDDSPVGMGIDAAGNVYVAGWSQGYGGSMYSPAWTIYTTIKYVQPTVSGLQEDEARPTQYWLSGCTPNPVMATANIRYGLPTDTVIHLRILDVIGRHVRNLWDGPQEAGSHLVTWNGTNDTGHRVASGLYFLRIDAGRFHQSRKVVVVR